MANLYYIQVTRKCNQECRFCSNPPNERVLSLKEGEKLIRYYKKKGCDGLIFTGGEPTLSPHLPEFLRSALIKKVPARIITNGQNLADINYLRSLKEAGLYHVHISLYSHQPKVQAFLTRNKDSLKNIIQALKNIGKTGGIAVNINTVINHYNAGHLLENVRWLTEDFPFINHFVWNNLDPSTTRAQKNKDTIPKLHELELSLHEAMVYLSGHKKTFRVERLPLCYLPEYEDVSTEARKIVKKEDRSTFFLDDRGFLNEKDWDHKWGYSKADCCACCSIRSVCPGLYRKDRYYSSQELYPVFIPKEGIIEKILKNP
ncbi:MAG: radical SAM protein [bacterium]|nr:radical SAM protein [bacterium]